MMNFDDVFDKEKYEEIKQNNPEILNNLDMGEINADDRKIIKKIIEQHPEGWRYKTVHCDDESQKNIYFYTITKYQVDLLKGKILSNEDKLI